MKKLITSIRVFFVFAILLGLVYPLFIMALGQLIFPYQANGSLITYHDKIIGSKLIAQEFNHPEYFHSRFSAVDYDATNSGASNLPTSSNTLYQQTQANTKKIKIENDLTPDVKLPADMVLSSASGLDPHISLDNAMLQLPRVVKYRGLSRKAVQELIYKHLDSDFVGIWGQPGVNVLKLNLALDKI
ncbi:MAG: K(+)-transporting ATPase subunit C [Gammaproteobacteria bacterium]|nr:K(+)-transporting ATPase subunit C [Gammaproteobacteria bacterium]